jgi:hypothetical protein
MKLRILDVLAVAVSLLVIGGFSVAAYAGKAASTYVVIEASGARWIYPLDTDREERIPGPLGDTLVAIRGGKAFVQDSPCPDKLCVHMPAISQQGQWIACLPNRVFVRVGGGSGPDIDQLSY